MLEVINEVARVLNTDAEADKILGETTFCSNCGGDRSMTRTPLVDLAVHDGSTHDMRQGMLIRLLTAPKDTLIPHNLVPPTIRSLNALSPVTKLNTAPAPLACL